MLECGKRGFKLFRCPNYGEEKVIPFGCNSRICTHCGKVFNDKWADQIARKTFDVEHRHIVLTIQDELRPFFKADRKLLKVLMDCVILTIAQVMKWELGKEVTEVIAVLHTYGKDMKWNPHVQSEKGREITMEIKSHNNIRKTISLLFSGYTLPIILLCKALKNPFTNFGRGSKKGTLRRYA